MEIDFNKRAEEVHILNEKWWVDLNTGERIERNNGNLLMLVLTELAEAAEGVRKSLKDDHLPHRSMIEVELADALIRILDFAGGRNFSFDKNLGRVVNYSFFDKKDEEFAFFVKESRNDLDIGVDPLEDLLELVKIVTNLHDLVKEPIQNVDLISENLSALVYGLYDYADNWNHDIEGSYHEKLEYNKTRADHKLEARRAEGGKKY